MLAKFVSETSEFSFKKRTFETFRDDLIPELLGRTGNQTAINTAGSAWKKDIRRYETELQDAGVTRNVKYDELLGVLEEHVSRKSDILNYMDDFREFDIRHLMESSEHSDKVLLGKFTRYREIMVDNLNRFKNDPTFRREIIKQICNERLELQKEIPIEYSYILLCLYIAQNYTYFDKDRYIHYISDLFDSKEDYLTKYYETLIDSSYETIDNLTAFCYTQYFWFDFRLSDSNESIIHSIIFGMFGELGISPTTEITLEEMISGDVHSPPEEQEDLDFEYPNAQDVESEYVEFEIVDAGIKSEMKEDRKKRRTKIIDFEIENRRNKKLGDQGELIVFYKEIALLKENDQDELSEKVELISRKDDSAGYDILSFELDGTQKHIEVKSTNSQQKNLSFYISAGELEKSQSLENYYIYIVFEAKTDHPKIWPIKDPLRFKNKGLVLVPVKFRAIISIE